MSAYARLGISVLIAAMWAGVTPSAQARRTENVVLVTIDGARWQEIFAGLDETLLKAVGRDRTDITTLPAYREFGAATPAGRRERLMPFLWRALAVDDGFIAGDRTAGSRVAVTNGHWFSYPGYSEILTGQAHDDVISSNDPIRNPFPSVLQFARRKLQLPPAKVATFASWGVFSSIVENESGATTVNAGYQHVPATTPELAALDALQSQALTPWENIRHDAFTFRFATDYLIREHPRVLYVAFDEPDDWAHDGNYELVLRALHRIDAHLNELWTMLQADAQYREKTMMIVTADHGRGRGIADWRRHGKDVPGADEVWIAIASPDTTRRGSWQSSPPIYQNQIAATIAAALGLDYRELNAQAGAPIDLGVAAPLSPSRGRRP
jgi:phosphopentomutase/2,3-bisphosphoglycerate-independent phosphoglycerate mutase family metalloenzyme